MIVKIKMTQARTQFNKQFFNPPFLIFTSMGLSSHYNNLDKLSGLYFIKALVNKECLWLFYQVLMISWNYELFSNIFKDSFILL